MTLARALSFPLAHALDGRRRFPATSSFSPASRFSGGKAGLLIDGIASTFLQTDGGAASGNADPLGRLNEISGNNNHLIQSTGALRLTTTVVNGVKLVSLAANCYLPTTMAAAIDGVYSCVSLMRAGAGTAFMSYYDGDDYMALAGVSCSMYIGNSEYTPITYPIEPDWFIVHHVHSGSGTNQFKTRMYNLADGSLAGSQTATVALKTRSTAYRIGYPFGTPQCDIAYQMELGDVLTTADFEADDLPYLMSRFSGLLP